VRVFLDTNGLASALATRGLCADVLRQVLARHVLLTSHEVRRELQRALTAKLGVPPTVAQELDRFLEREAVTVPTGKPSGKAVHDEADRLILGTAVAGGAELFVTGDKELQRAARIASMRIVSPRQFWQLLRG